MVEKTKNETHSVKRGLRPWATDSPVSWLMFIVIVCFVLFVRRGMASLVSFSRFTLDWWEIVVVAHPALIVEGRDGAEPSFLNGSISRRGCITTFNILGAEQNKCYPSQFFPPSHQPKRGQRNQYKKGTTKEGPRFQFEI
jgi:hypothetical protein